MLPARGGGEGCFGALGILKIVGLFPSFPLPSLTPHYHGAGGGVREGSFIWEPSTPYSLSPPLRPTWIHLFLNCNNVSLHLTKWEADHENSCPNTFVDI